MSFRARQTTYRRRRSPGSILCFATVLAMCFGVAMVWAFLFGIFLQAQHRVEMASEAASLAAANAASNVVINDQHFGFIALTDQPAGKATLNPNGDPMPVMGINTLVATCRFDLLVAEKLNNQDMIKMAKADSTWAAQTCVSLNQAVSNALDPSSSQKPIDKDGMPVDAYSGAKAAFLSNMPTAYSKIQLNRLKLSLGYLSSGCGSSTAAPQPLSMSQTDQTTQSGGYYNAFIDVPVSGQDYHFAGFLTRTGLVKRELFQPADPVRPCSVICAQGQVNFSEVQTGSQPLSIKFDSCAVPGANPDLTPPAVLALRIDQNLLASFPNWTSLLSYNQLSSNPAILRKVNGGDYPTSPNCFLTIDPQFSQSGQSTIAQLAAKGLYDWLRTCHAKANIDAIVNKMLPQSFPSPNASSSYTYLTYDVNTNDGSIIRQSLQSFPWSSTVVRDDQDLSDYAVTATPHPAIYFVDEVTRLGKDGGLHAGQPLVDALAVTNPYKRVYPPNGLAVSIELDQ